MRACAHPNSNFLFPHTGTHVWRRVSRDSLEDIILEFVFCWLPWVFALTKTFCTTTLLRLGWILKASYFVHVTMGGSPGDVSEATEGLDNELWRRWTDGKVWRMSSAHYPTLPSLYLRNSSFSNPSVALSTPVHSPTLPSLHLRHNSFSNPSVALPT